MILQVLWVLFQALTSRVERWETNFQVGTPNEHIIAGVARERGGLELSAQPVGHFKMVAV